jgi:hypothetical protein
VARVLLGRTTHTSYFSGVQDVAWPVHAASAAALVAIAAALIAAGWYADRSGVREYERPLAFGIAACALIVVPASFLGGVGAAVGAPLLRPPLGPLLVAVPALWSCAAAARSGWRPHPSAIRRRLGPRSTRLIVASAVVLLLASAAIALSQPPTGFDALSYHGPLAVYLWRDGNIAAYLSRSVSGFALAQPASAELWFGLLLMAAGERVANLGQLPFALLGACAVAALARRNGACRSAAQLAGSAFLLAPIVALQAGMQLTDVMAGALVVSAAALVCCRPREWTIARGTLVGLALGLAAVTKIAVVPAVAAIVAFAWIRLRLDPPDLLGRTARRPVAMLAVAFAVTVAPWWIRNTVLYGNPLYPAALPLIGRGIRIADFAHKDTNFVPSLLAWPLYPLLEPLSDQSGFGALLIVAALPGIVFALLRHRRAPLVLLVSMAVCAVPVWWTETLHEPRMLLPLAAVALAFVPTAAAVPGRAMRRGARVLIAGAALFTALSTADQALLPRLAEHYTRTQFYDVVWNVDPAVAAAPEDIPLLYNTGYASLSYAGDYPLLGPSRRRTLFTVDTDASTDGIRRVMRDSGVQFAYVPASPAAQREVLTKYDDRYFALEHVSEIADGDRAGTKRYLFRLREAHDGSESPAPISSTAQWTDGAESGPLLRSGAR